MVWAIGIRYFGKGYYTKVPYPDRKKYHTHEIQIHRGLRRLKERRHSQIEPETTTF